MCLKFCKPAFVASALLLFVIACEAQTSNPQTATYTDYDVSTWTGHTSSCPIGNIRLTNKKHIKTLDDNFLRHCGDITSVDTQGLSIVMSIGNHFLGGCIKLTSVNTQGLSNVLRIGNNFLAGCKALTSLSLEGLLKLQILGINCLSESRVTQLVVPCPNFPRCCGIAVDYGSISPCLPVVVASSTRDQCIDTTNHPSTHYKHSSIIINPFSLHTNCTNDEDVAANVGSDAWWTSVALCLACVLLACLANGLCLGLLSLEPLQLAISLETRQDECETEEERDALRDVKSRVRKVLPLLHRHHLLLVALLLTMATADEFFPMSLSNVVPMWLAVIISIGSALLFVEILPTAVFTGPSQLRYGAMFTKLVWAMLYTFFVIAYPLSKVLDYLFGHDESLPMLSVAELKALFRVHGPHQLGKLSNMEVAGLSRTLELSQRASLEELATPLANVLWPSTQVVDATLVEQILQKGLSYIAVAETGSPGRVQAFLPVTLLGPSTYGHPLGSLVNLWHKGAVLFVDPSMDRLTCLRTMKRCRVKYAVVLQGEDHVGYFTFSRVMSELLAGMDVADEMPKGSPMGVSSRRATNRFGEMPHEALMETAKQTLRQDRDQVSSIYSEESMASFRSSAFQDVRDSLMNENA